MELFTLKLITRSWWRNKIFFFISYFLSFEFYANASMANLPRNRGRSGLNSGPRMERCGCCAASAWQKETPGCHRQPGAIIPYILRFDPGDGSGLGAAPCVSGLAE